REPGIAGDCYRHCGDVGAASGKNVSVSVHDRDSAGVRRNDDYSDWRSRHADGDFAVEFLCGIISGGNGICAAEQTADYRRGAGRSVGLYPFGEHVEGDEPVVHERAVWRVWTGTGEGGGGKR